MKKTETAKKTKKMNAKRIMAIVLAALMVVGAASTTIYMIAASFI